MTSTRAAGRRSAVTAGGLPVPVPVLALALALACGCGPRLRVTAADIAPESLTPIRCVAVMPFSNQSGDAKAGDLVAAMAGSTLVLTGAFDVLEVNTARRLNAPGMKPLGELGIDAVLSGNVLSFTRTPVPDGRGLAVTVELKDARKGTVMWSGDAFSDDAPFPALAVLAAFTQRALDRVLEPFAADNDNVTGPQDGCATAVAALAAMGPRIQLAARSGPPAPSTASPLVPVAAPPLTKPDAATLAARESALGAASGSAAGPATLAPAPVAPMAGGVAGGPAAPGPGPGRPGAGQPALGSETSPGSGSAAAGSPSATASGPAARGATPDASAGKDPETIASTEPTPAAATGGELAGLPGIPGLPAAGAGASPPAGSGDALPALPGDALPALPGDALPALPGGPLPALPGDALPALPGGPLPALPGDALPALPGGPLPALPGDALPALPGDQLPALPSDSLPALPGDPMAATGGSLAAPDEYAGLPYAPAAPEPPPAIKGKVKPKQKQLLKQLYLGTAVIRRLFKPAKKQLVGNAKKQLAELGMLLRSVKDLKVVFEVHADTGNAARSQTLSDKQMALLKKIVEKQFAYAKGRIHFRSIGSRQPLAKDVSGRARLQNSRVEIVRVY